MPVQVKDMVRRVRELVAVIEGTNKNFRDGFASDADTDPDLIPILPSINDFQNLCALSGAKPRDVAIPVVVGQRDYQTPDNVATVIQVYFNGRALTETTREALDRTDPLWQIASGDPARWFVQGDIVTLDRPTASGIMTWRCGLVITPFDGSDPFALTDSCLSMSQIQRVPFGTAYLLMNIDTLNQSHAARIANYKAVADGLLSDIRGRSHNRDTSKRVSFDTWVPDMQYPGATPVYGNDDTAVPMNQ